MAAERSAEESLLTRAREGDVRAYEELVEQHQGTAFRVAWLITRSTPDAEEAAQDGFVKAYRSLGRFRAGAPFRPWLLRIAAEAEVLAAGEREELLAAVARLDDRDRLVIGARFFLDLSEAETAAALGVRRGTVKSRLSRALDRLRKEVEGDG